MHQIQNPHWFNLVPDTGSLIVPLVEGTDQPYLHGREYKLTDGRIATAMELLHSPENVHGLSGATLRRRLNDLGVRDPDALFAATQNRGRGSVTAKARRAARLAEVAA